MHLSIKTMSNLTDRFVTKDLYIAALLYSSGFKFLGVEMDGRVGWFAFDDGDKARGIEQAYWSKEAMVVAREFVDAIRTMKDLVLNRST